MENVFFESLFTEELYRVVPKPTIVITQSWSELGNEEKEQLTKITEVLRKQISPRLGLEAFEVKHVQLLDLGTWAEKPEKLIYFGQPIKGLTNYEVIEVPGTKMVLSDPLAQLISDDNLRKRLWAALQQLFVGQ